MAEGSVTAAGAGPVDAPGPVRVPVRDGERPARAPGSQNAGRPRVMAAILTVLVVAAACTTGSSTGPSPSGPVALSVGLGYIPSVQFAQFYLAQQRGYYRDAGLEVTFQNKIDPDLIRLVGQGSVDVAIADGTSLIPAVSQGIPVQYIATIYAKFPNIVFAKPTAGIATAADLKGKRIGTPGRYGSGWIMLQTLLGSVGLTTDDVTIVEYPDYGQLAGLEQGAVDAATGFVNNEPVQLARTGVTPVILRVDDIVPLPGNGLIVGTATAAAKGPAISAFVAATLRAMDDIIKDPQAGLDAAIAAVPELGSDRATQLAVLQATIDTWQSPTTQAAGLGAIDPVAWQKSIDQLKSLPGDLVPNPVTVDQLISTSFLPK
jgi:NitT/TauT family transport system substrate-binding protein